MAKTVVGLMDDIGEAQIVARDLVDSGIDRNAIGFMANEGHSISGTAALNESEGGDAASGGILVAVAADSQAQANTAVGILMRHGALDIEAGTAHDASPSAPLTRNAV